MIKDEGLLKDVNKDIEDSYVPIRSNTINASNAKRATLLSRGTHNNYSNLDYTCTESDEHINIVEDIDATI